MPKCKQCGASMIQLLTKQGDMFYLCPHTQVHVQGGLRKIGFMFCTTATEPNTELPPHMIDTKESADLYALFTSMKQNFETFTSETDLTLEALREATQNAVDDNTLLEHANLAIMLELPIEQLPELFSNAMKLGHAVGVTSDYSIMSLAKGIGRRSYLILDNIGISMRSDTAYKWFKSEHGLETLTESQKRIAWHSFAMKLVKEKAQTLCFNKAQLKRERIRTQIQNLKIKAGQTL